MEKLPKADTINEASSEPVIADSVQPENVEEITEIAEEENASEEDMACKQSLEVVENSESLKENEELGIVPKEIENEENESNAVVNEIEQVTEGATPRRSSRRRSITSPLTTKTPRRKSIKITEVVEEVDEDTEKLPATDTIDQWNSEPTFEEIADEQRLDVTQNSKAVKEGMEHNTEKQPNDEQFEVVNDSVQDDDDAEIVKISEGVSAGVGIIEKSNIETIKESNEEQSNKDTQTVETNNEN
uniref:Uncharacterized protein n=1 Tax=Megaselia scalaris TaxID=36166 RepID=T1H3P0_MEGSC